MDNEEFARNLLFPDEATRKKRSEEYEKELQTCRLYPDPDVLDAFCRDVALLLQAFSIPFSRKISGKIKNKHEDDLEGASLLSTMGIGAQMTDLRFKQLVVTDVSLFESVLKEQQKNFEVCATRSGKVMLRLREDTHILEQINACDWWWHWVTDLDMQKQMETAAKAITTSTNHGVYNVGFQGSISVPCRTGFGTVGAMVEKGENICIDVSRILEITKKAESFLVSIKGVFVDLDITVQTMRAEINDEKAEDYFSLTEYNYGEKTEAVMRYIYKENAQKKIGLYVLPTEKKKFNSIVKAVNEGNSKTGIDFVNKCGVFKHQASNVVIDCSNLSKIDNVITMTVYLEPFRKDVTLECSGNTIGQVKLC
jgi:hypothetical protein